MHISSIIELIPAMIGLFLAGVLFLVVLMVAASKVRRMIFGRRSGDGKATGVRAFLENFD